MCPSDDDGNMLSAFWSPPADNSEVLNGYLVTLEKFMDNSPNSIEMRLSSNLMEADFSGLGKGVMKCEGMFHGAAVCRDWCAVCVGGD